MQPSLSSFWGNSFLTWLVFQGPSGSRGADGEKGAQGRPVGVRTFCLLRKKYVIKGSVAERLGQWACNLLVSGSRLPLCQSLDLFFVAQSSIPWLRFVYNHLVCLLPIGFFKHCLFIQLFIHLFICIGPEKPTEEQPIWYTYTNLMLMLSIPNSFYFSQVLPL